MKKTVLITGTSSGIGKAAAFEFAAKGWNVIATQRNPEKENDFSGLSNITLLKLDVTDPKGTELLFEKIKKDFNSIDVVVNNAGFGVDGIFEAMSDEIIYQQFDTNVFGLMRITRAAVKMMREQQGGTIIQISSMGGKVTFPLYSIYHATKFAVEGFTESLHYELLPFNIKLKLIEPGLIGTEFYGTSRHFVKPSETKAYDDYLRNFEMAAKKAMKSTEKPEVVAKKIYLAATDKSNRLRYPVGAPSPMLIILRKFLSDKMYFGLIRKSYNI
jgi:short-subunit dehydrogenase